MSLNFLHPYLINFPRTWPNSSQSIAPSPGNNSNTIVQCRWTLWYKKVCLLYKGVLYVEAILYSKECNWYTRCCTLKGSVHMCIYINTCIHVQITHHQHCKLEMKNLSHPVVSIINNVIPFFISM